MFMYIYTILKYEKETNIQMDLNESIASHSSIPIMKQKKNQTVFYNITVISSLGENDLHHKTILNI